MLQNKFTKNAVQAVNYANKTCVRLGSQEMTLEHLFMGILYVKEGVGSKILSKLGLDPDATLKSIEQELSSEKTNKIEKDEAQKETEVAEVIISREIKKVFEKAFDYAINSGHSYVGTEHLLLGMLDIKENFFVKELHQLGISFKKVKEELDAFVQYPDLNPQNEENRGFPMPTLPGVGQSEKNQPQAGFFESFGRNLTQEARDGKLDPVIGRSQEIMRVMQVLSRRTKNNPILLGDAGVGKTAIVEGLAQMIADGAVSPVLANYEIWSVDTASIVAGSQLRGDVESKILDMISEVEEKGNIIIFIDEIHTILGAGATSNSSLDIANILKPALARGILHCIGATTVDEYRRYFDEDPALQRRFQPVDVEELSEADAYQVLKNLKPIYEAFHGVKISDQALKSAIKLSSRFIADRYLPDKAIDVLDEACAKNKLERVQVTDNFRKLLEQLKKIVGKKSMALDKKKIEEAATYLDDEKKVIDELAHEEKKMKADWDKGKKNITEKEIKAVIHSWTKIPMTSMDESTGELIKKLDKDLYKNVVGQEYAVKLVSNSIKRAKAGLSGFERPLASFLFVGPTGVGKTELAKQLAKSLFGTKEALIQVDMSELMEGHSVSKLIGSPPGYVGFDEGGQLTDKVRRRPFSVILFDEIEKASPEVLNILLQIMDEGRLTDSKGRSINFKNTIIIMTSNIGARLLLKDSTVGIYLGEVKNEDGVDQIVLDTQEKIVEQLKEYLQPEFMNRIDDVVVFRGLKKTDITPITKLHIENFVKRIKKENNIVLKNADSKEIVEYITDSGYSEEYGAREVRRVIRSTLENAVADKILDLNWDSDSKKALSLDVKLNGKNIEVSEVKEVLKPKTVVKSKVKEKETISK